MLNEYKDCIYKIAQEDETKINLILNNFFEKMDNCISNDCSIDNYSLASVLITIAENYEHFADKKHWLKNIKTILLRVKYLIENEFFDYNLGIMNGLAEIDIAVYFISCKTNAFKVFSQQVHSVLIKRAKLFIAYCVSNLENLTLKHYDLIFGATGIGESILMRDNLNHDDTELVKDILFYLNILSWKITINKNISVPRFYIKSENQMREDEKLDFPNGNLNFGLAHGMLGPMVFMAKALSKGISIHNQKNAIYSIYKFYEDFGDKANEVLYWPTQLSIEKFLNNDKIDTYRIRRASWCYGTAGISRGLYITGRYLGDTSIKDIGLKSLNALAKSDFQQYSLISPIICHGYSGLLNIFMLMRNEEITQVYDNSISVLLNKLLDSYTEESEYGFISVDEMVNDKKEVSIVESEKLDLLEGATGIVLTLMALYNGSSIMQEQILLE